MRLLRASLLMACVALAACTTTRKIPLNYSPSDAGIVPGPGTAKVSIGTVNDRRESPGAPLGTVHSGIGKSTKEIQPAAPLTSVVREFFTDALRNRGAYAAASSEEINVDILEFDADQFIRRTVTINLLVTLHDAKSGYDRRSVPIRIQRTQGGLLNADNLVVGNFLDFQKFVEGALSEAADKGVGQVLPTVKSP